MERKALIAARYKKHLSREELAELVGVQSNTIYRWESGETGIPRGYNLRALCDALGATAEELGLTQETAQHEAVSTASRYVNEQRQPTPLTNELSVTSTISALNLPIILPPSELDILDMIHSRRQILRATLNAACTTFLLSPHLLLHSENQERLKRAMKDPSRIDAHILDDLSSITNSYWRLCANASVDILSGLSGHFTTIVDLLKWPHPTPIYLRLCTLAGENAQLLGKTLYDIREYQLAWAYYAFSVKTAKEAQNADLWAVGLGRMALLLIYCGLSRSALPLVQDAQHLEIKNARILAWLASIEAEIHAFLVDGNACTHALRIAKDITDTSTFQADTYATGFNLSRQLGYEGACCVRLRQSKHALPVLQKALDTTRPTAVRRFATLYADMGSAYAQLGDVKKACLFARQALDITAQVKSLSTLQRLYTIKDELAPWKSNAEVKHLNEQFASTIATIVKAKETL